LLDLSAGGLITLCFAYYFTLVRLGLFNSMQTHD